MKGVLVIAHGSRATETEAVLDAIVEMVRENLPDRMIECAFMGNSDRTAEKAVAALAENNVSEIKIIPYFLFMGIHLKEDIPEMVAELVKDYPEIEISMTDSLGADRRLAEIVIDKIVEN
ncbi:MAG: CbiX/SirB N-terminal domain-containing protein [Oscillospiraceae bacterium]|nr:CbiX/SirB N-terminal domain-containing protein [Oscillospiraceae bacterium]